MKKIGNKYILLIVALSSIIIGMTISSISFYSTYDKTNNFLAHAESILNNSPDIQNALSVQKAFRLVAKTIIPTVVNISTEIVVKQQLSMDNNPFSRFFGQDWFDFYFGDQPKTRDFVQKALGTGVIIDEDGFILTNLHVVQNASKIIVKLSNGKEYKAKVIGIDSKTDLALIKIDTKDKLPIPPIGNSDEIEVGDWAIAIGNPFGLNETYTVGVISAKGRSGIVGDSSRYENYIQTDAPINPGNSGGALVNIQGQLIGINTAIATPSGGNVGIGFAIPINVAKTVFDQLKDKGKVIRGWLGVNIQDLTPDIAKHFNLKNQEGVLVADVIEKSPASDAGLKSGDIIIEYDKKDIKNVNQLRNQVAETKPNTRINIKIIRQNKSMELKIKIGEMAEDTSQIAQKSSAKYWLGFKAESINDQNLNNFNLSKEDKIGVMITEIQNNSLAEVNGLQVGDIIKQINNEKINTINDFDKFTNENSKTESFLFVIKRKGRLFYLSLDNSSEEK